MDFLEHGIYGKNFAMLGLGDIVIPGNGSTSSPRVSVVVNRRLDLTDTLGIGCQILADFDRNN